VNAALHGCGGSVDSVPGDTSGPAPAERTGPIYPDDRAVHGTGAWQEVSLVLDVLEGSTDFAFGSGLAGTGKVWIVRSPSMSRAGGRDDTALRRHETIAKVACKRPVPPLVPACRLPLSILARQEARGITTKRATTVVATSRHGGCRARRPDTRPRLRTPNVDHFTSEEPRTARIEARTRRMA